MRFGKLAPKHSYKTLLLKDYMMPALPPPPATFDSIPRVQAALGISDIATLFPMDHNDEYGDCTIAGAAHAHTIHNGVVGIKDIMAADDVLAVYMQLSGGQDSGLAMLDVLDFWQSTGIGGERILGYAKLRLHNAILLRQAISMFNCVYLGFQCQENAVEEFQNGQPWTPGPLTNDGHCVVFHGYDPNGIKALTWGGDEPGTQAWVDECVDEAYVILPPEAQQPGFSPGWNYQQLAADIKGL